MTNGMESTNWERVVFSRLIPWDPFLQSSPLFSLELVCRTTVCTSVSGKAGSPMMRSYLERKIFTYS